MGDLSATHQTKPQMQRPEISTHASCAFAPRDAANCNPVHLVHESCITERSRCALSWDSHCDLRSVGRSSLDAGLGLSLFQECFGCVRSRQPLHTCRISSCGLVLHAPTLCVSGAQVCMALRRHTRERSARRRWDCAACARCAEERFEDQVRPGLRFRQRGLIDNVKGACCGRLVSVLRGLHACILRAW